MNKEAFVEVMKSHRDTYDILAEAIGLTRQAIYLKVNGKNQFTRVEIAKLIKRWNLTQEQVINIFFA